MRRGWKITLVTLSLLLITGIAAYYTVWPRIVLSIVLNSYPKEPWLVKLIQEDVVLIVYDKKTEQALGKSTPENFRTILTKLLPLEKASVVMLDVHFESETRMDQLLQKKLDENFRIVWARTEDKQSRFLRRVMRSSPPEPLPLGHITIAYLTVLRTTKLQAVPFCIMADDGEALPPIALVTYQLYSGMQTLKRGDCSVWERGAPSETQTSIGNVPVVLSQRSKDIPPIIDKAGRRWMPIRYMGPEGFFRRISLIDVLEKRVSPEEFKDKVVLIGANVPDDTGYLDRRTTEVGEMDGIEIQANILATIMRALIRKAN